MLLTHQDDVADHAKFHERFGCERVLHRDDVAAARRRSSCSRRGIEPVDLGDELLMIPTPGHTRGHAVFLYRETYPLHRRPPRLEREARSSVRVPQRLLVFVERADRVDGAAARLPLRVGPARSWPAGASARRSRCAQLERCIEWMKTQVGTSVALPGTRERDMGKYLTVFKQTFTEFGEDKVPRLGAALAYYTIFSIAPLLLIAIAMAGLVFGQEAAQGQISGELAEVLGARMAEAMQEMIEARGQAEERHVATIVGVDHAAPRRVRCVRSAQRCAEHDLERRAEEEPPGSWASIKERFLSMAMVLGIGFLLLVSLLFDAAIAAMGTFAAEPISGRRSAAAERATGVLLRRRHGALRDDLPLSCRT